MSDRQFTLRLLVGQQIEEALANQGITSIARAKVRQQYELQYSILSTEARTRTSSSTLAIVSSTTAAGQWSTSDG